ncbi:MAG: Ig-like domain-containing protein [Bacillota bacterium]|nr:Ig-like domain-containing protein [Bacillota bacterium]
MLKSSRKRAGAKVSLVLLSIFLFLFIFASAAAAATYGDVNDDGNINVLDVVLIQQHVLGLEELTEAQETVADVNGDGNINVQDVTLIMQYALGLVDEFPHAALEVSSVTAVNPKQVEVEFNRMLKPDERSNMTSDNFHVGLQASPSTDRLTGTGSAVEIMDDGKTVLLTMADGYYFVNGSTTNRVIVKKEVGITADYTVNDLVFVDTSVPTLESVHTESPRTIVLTFSEPLDNSVIPTNITLNGGAIALNLVGGAYNDARRELRINSYSDLSAGSYTLGISSGTSLKDYSGFSVAPTSKTFTHSPITTAPTVSVKSATVNSVTIEFSRAINPTTLVNNTSVLFRHTVETSTYYQVTGTSVTNPSGDARTFVIDFTGKTLPVGETTLWMKYVDGTIDANKVKDTWSNIILPFSLAVTTTFDTTAPTATVSVNSNTQIDVQYSEAVQGATTPSNYSLKKDSTTVSISSVADLGGNKYRLTTASQMQGQHTLTISNIKDTSPAENPMDTQSYTINVPDTITPKVVNLSGNPENKFYKLNPISKVRIFFNEAMNQIDLATKSMYENVIYSNANPTEVIPASDGKSVYLEFANNVTGDLRVGSLRDLAGNSLGIATTLSGVPFVLGLDPGITNPVIATTPTVIKVYLSGIVNSASIVDFEVRIDNDPVDWVNPSNITIDNSSGKSVLTLTLAGAEAIGYDAKDDDDDVTQVRTVSSPGVAGEATYTKDAYGFPVNIAATTIVDRIVPIVESVDYINSTTIEITLKENIDGTTMSGSGVNGFSVSGGTLTKAEHGGLGNEDKINLTGSGFTENTDVYYNSAAGITDMSGNYLASFSRTSTLD